MDVIAAKLAICDKTCPYNLGTNAFRFRAFKPEDDKPLSLDMSFDKALEMLLNTPPPDGNEEEEIHQEERKDDCE